MGDAVMDTVNSLASLRGMEEGRQVDGGKQKGGKGNGRELRKEIG